LIVVLNSVALHIPGNKKCVKFGTIGYRFRLISDIYLPVFIISNQWSTDLPKFVKETKKAGNAAMDLWISLDL
jgi:hypothetical protein